MKAYYYKSKSWMLTYSNDLTITESTMKAYYYRE